VGDDWPVEKYDIVEGGEEEVCGFRGDEGRLIGCMYGNSILYQMVDG